MTRKRYLIISNGHGEDWIAAALAARLPSDIQLDAYPMIGAGNAYAGICPIVGPRARLNSGGARTARGSLRRDLAKGGLAMIPPLLKFLRGLRGRYDRVIVVGDAIVPTLSFATGLRDLYYIDCYKTGAARLYSSAEKFILARTCKMVFCRAQNLADMLRQSGIDARAPGNLMMDTIPRGDYDAASRRNRPFAVTLLPGSRGETSVNFARQIGGLRLLPDAAIPDIFLSVAGDISIDELASAAGLRRTHLLSGESDDLGTATDGRLTVHLLRGSAMGNALDVSDIVLSQAGTATVQALGLGKPVIYMTNPEDRQSRFLDEQAFYGEARIPVPGEPQPIADALSGLMNSPEKRQRLGETGQQRIGPPGAMEAVLSALADSAA